jgi:hydrogenase expression/formation protein HypC
LTRELYFLIFPLVEEVIMCLGVPGKVVEIIDDNGILMGKIDYNGTINKVCLAYIPDIKVGQYTVVHAGFAISVIDEEEAKKTLSVWDELKEKLAIEGTDVFGQPLDRSINDEKRYR